VREEWAAERARLARAAEEWEARAKRVDVGFADLESQRASTSKSGPSNHLPNGHSRLELNGRTSSSGGLVTPPSPRSLSADSGRPRRRRRAGSSRGRSRSRSPGTSASGDEAMTDSTSMTSVSQGGDEGEGTETGKDIGDGSESGPGLGKSGRAGAAKHGSGSLITPASSVHIHMTDGEGSIEPPAKSAVSRRAVATAYVAAHPIPSTALGVLVLGIAAAVIWNTKLKE